MTLPVWMLVGFAAWTVLLLLATVGVYRWSRILTGRVPIRNFRADQIEGPDWYKRAMRAHANCVENLPVFAAIVFGLHVGNVSGDLVNALAVAVLVARIVQSLVHVCFDQTNAVTSVRSGFFAVQIASFLWLIGILVTRLSGMRSVAGYFGG
jgi:uncharacterized MAPEG superfamily protein